MYSQAQRSKADESAGCVCAVNAGEREDDEEINNEESDDTLNRTLTPKQKPEKQRKLIPPRDRPIAR